MAFFRRLEQNPIGHKTVSPRRTKRPQDVPICIFLVWRTSILHIHYSRVFWNRCHTTQVDMDCITRQIQTKGIVDRIRRTIEHGMISLWTSSGAHITKWLREGWRYAWNNHQRLGQERRWNKTALSDMASRHKSQFILSFTATDLEYSCKRESSWLRRTTIAFGIKHLQENCLQD